jgi:TfoX/Sxy family transcriptional regulator of competence genes
MATELQFVEFVHEQSGLGARLSYRKMFGEYGFHLDGKFVAMACDDTLFIKPTDSIGNLGFDLPSRPPYPGAKHAHLMDQASNNLLDPTALRAATSS